MKFEWDRNKAKLNIQKYKVSFEEAVSALNDPMSATGLDPDHSISEYRFITFGLSEKGRLLAVAHTDKGQIIRIISASLASRGERKLYEEE